MTAASGPGAPVVHVAEPVRGTAYTVAGPLTGRPFDERLPRAYPAEALCSCGQMIRREGEPLLWEHTGRRPGETG